MARLARLSVGVAGDAWYVAAHSLCIKVGDDHLFGAVVQNYVTRNYGESIGRSQGTTAGSIEGISPLFFC